MSHAEALEQAIEQSHAALAAIIGGDVGERQPAAG